MASLRVGLTRGSSALTGHSAPLLVGGCVASGAGAFEVQVVMGSVLLEWGSPTAQPPGAADHPDAFCLPFLWHLCAPIPKTRGAKSS